MNGRITTSLYGALVVVVVLHQACNFETTKSRTGQPDRDQVSEYLDQGKWDLAIQELESQLDDNPGRINTHVRLGQAYLGSRLPETALSIFESLIAQKGNKIIPEVYFWAGRACHQLGRFNRAESYYRTYVREAENADLVLVGYFMKQVGAARQAGSAESQYLVQNTGHVVNSPLDEFKPIYSPNVNQRFYYSIHDPGIGSAPPHSTLENLSMRSAEIIQGIWASTAPLDSELAGDTEHRLFDFSPDGQRVYFSSLEEDHSRITYEKLYDASPGQPVLRVWDHPVFRSELGDRDLFVINDSAFLFSSDRLEGYGGYDIYITFLRLGDWLIQNLGPVVNSQFDEISPYLSNNGRTLYFSSNSDKSIGGYDVFFTTFDDEMETWSPPQNMLPPLNSGLNDLDFRLSMDGREALFSSDRPGGYGGLDIFQVFFNEPKPEQISILQPPYFYQVRAYRAFSAQGPQQNLSTDKPIYHLPVLHFTDRPVVITAAVQEKLDKVLEIGKLYPHTRLLLQIFTDQPTEDPFVLYRPVLLLNRITEYLMSGGMDSSRLQFRLYGNQYPLSAGIKQSGSGVSHISPINCRVEFNFTNTENLPVQFGVPVTSVDTSNLSPYHKWQELIQDLHFRIQLVETEQLMKDGDLPRIEDLMLIVSGNGKQFTYYGGILNNMGDARKALGRYRAMGYMKSEVTAFIGTNRIADDRITAAMIQEYPELKEYIIYQK